MTLCCRRKDGSNRGGMFEEVKRDRGERAGSHYAFQVGDAQLPCSSIFIYSRTAMNWSQLVMETTLSLLPLVTSVICCHAAFDMLKFVYTFLHLIVI
jgi:hypothetical protein